MLPTGKATKHKLLVSVHLSLDCHKTRANADNQISQSHLESQANTCTRRGRGNACDACEQVKNKNVRIDFRCRAIFTYLRSLILRVYIRGNK